MAEDGMESNAGRLPAGPTWRGDPLPYARREAQAIRKICRAHIFAGNRCCESAFFRHSSRAGILHFATHAFADTTFDAFCGLVLAPTDQPEDDGLLMGYELADHDLSCDLVAISACETGVGKKLAGEGVLGLPRIFIGAGARSVLMTLWKVDDRFASELMPKFYDGFLRRGLPTWRALRQAQQTMFRVRAPSGRFYGHPIFWAAFNLYGEPVTAPTSAGGHPLLWLALVGLILVTVFFVKIFRAKLS